MALSNFSSLRVMDSGTSFQMRYVGDISILFGICEIIISIH